MVASKILDGKIAASTIRAAIKVSVAALGKKSVVPGLAVVLVGDNPASHSYVKGKTEACQAAGIRTFDHTLSADLLEKDLLSLIEKLNHDEAVHGILVQLPLPSHVDTDLVIASIDPLKDVDGFHPLNVGRMVLGQDSFLPCTPHGILKLLEVFEIPVQGKHVVICGRSDIVGKPLANLLLKKGSFADATVTVCHSRTKNLSHYTLQADIVVAAMGKAKFIGAEMIKQGAVVIDVGVNRIADPSKKSGFSLVGDVDFEACLNKASWISPVPGGVGPMTITMLLHNTMISAMRHHNISMDLAV